jgi:hypothetical protein
LSMHILLLYLPFVGCEHPLVIDWFVSLLPKPFLPTPRVTIIIDHWYMDYIYPNLLSMIHVREWNIMIISKLQVWWVIDWTRHVRSQTRSSCATIEGPKHFSQVKQNYVHKPTYEQRFVVFNL